MTYGITTYWKYSVFGQRTRIYDTGGNFRPSVRLSVRPSVRQSVRPSVLPSVRPSVRPVPPERLGGPQRASQTFMGPQIALEVPQGASGGLRGS